MPDNEYEITVAALVPVYAKMRIRARSHDAAKAIGDHICRRPWKSPEMPIQQFEPEWSTMRDFRVFHIDEAKSTEGDAAPLTAPVAAE